MIHPHTHSPRTKSDGFTLIELLTVITIIIILVGIVLFIAPLAQEKAARSRATNELKAIETAIKSYEADFASVPTSSQTDSLDPRTAFNPSGYGAASNALFRELNPRAGAEEGGANQNDKVYLKSTLFKEELRDPWGNPYGYSTARNAAIADGETNPSVGYNPSYDLWSTGGANNADKAGKWITNWN